MKDRSAEEVAKIFKGAANAHRFNMLLELRKRPGQSVSDLADQMKINFRTASEHTKKLVAADLVTKHYQGQSVEHRLSPLGLRLLKLTQNL